MSLHWKNVLVSQNPMTFDLFDTQFQVARGNRTKQAKNHAFKGFNQA